MTRWLLGALLLLFAASPLAVDAAATGASTTSASTDTAPAARVIVLVRHGSYVADPAVDPQVGPPLSPLGVAQAHLAGARLAGLGWHFAALHVSPMQRARDTAAVIAGDFPGRSFQVENDLAECVPPTRRTEVTQDTSPAELAACKTQLDRLFARYFRPASGGEQAELFVCHGDVIRYLVTRALGVDPTAWLEMSVRNASITQIRVEADGRFKVITVGDDGFMPASLLTGATGDRERSLAVPRLPLQ